MLYLVEAHASMERGNKIDGQGPGDRRRMALMSTILYYC